MPGVDSAELRRHAVDTLVRIKSLSQDAGLQVDCPSALAEWKHALESHGQEIALSPVATARSTSRRRVNE